MLGGSKNGNLMRAVFVHYLGPLAQKIFSVSDSDPIPELKSLRVAQIHTIKAVKNTNPQYTRTMCE